MASPDQHLPAKCLPLLVEEQALTRPNALAVAAGERTLTYGELNHRAAELASRLRAIGVGPDVVVGLCLKSSLAMVVGALGILKSGAAYLPLDPAYPAQRLSHILNDARTSAVVTAQCSRDCLPTGAQSVIGLDIEGRVDGTQHIGPVAASPAPAFASGPTLENLAYVIYTSGSTGQPKGVEVAHRSLLNLIHWHQCAFAVTPDDRASQVAGVGFDAAVWELWPYLTAGASVHIADDDVRGDPEALRNWLLSRQITIGFVPTAMAERIMALDWPAKAPLRVVLTGADTLHHYPSRKLPFLLVNNYGPTECTVVATSGAVLPDDKRDGPPAIGRPIANTRVYILDDGLKPAPAGTAGELYIAGAGVARGYLNRPDLTAERFIPDPFGTEPGARMYKTGDLGFALPDGQIAFVGRIDEQVKIRGYRIEPNEIVSALNQHPAVQESAVVAQEFAEGDKRLAAYFVPAADAQPSYADLRDFLLARLPDYMVPPVFVRLERLPRNANGKVDRSALPQPSPENTLEVSSSQAPCSAVEERVAGILAGLLGGRQVGMDDNFFQLGGHSLLGAQLIARIRDSFGVELPLRALFEHPTVRGMSEEIESLILAKLESMGEEEARRLLASPSGEVAA